jgi:tubulin beta
VFCDEHGKGGSGEHFGENDAHLKIINVLYHEASGGRYVLRAVLFNIEPGLIDTVRASSLGCLFCPGNRVCKLGQRPQQQS